MGLIQTLARRHTYIDANIFVYAVEQVPPFAAALDQFFREVALRAQPATTSELTLAEVLVYPFLRASDRDRQAFEQAVRTQGGLVVAPVTRPVLIEAARLRATTSLKLPDAIHVATALQAGCEVFLTNDARIQGPPGLEVMRLADALP